MSSPLNPSCTILSHEPKTTTATLPPVTGKIIEIIQDSTEQHSFVVIDIFQLAATRHEVFGVLVLVRRQDEGTTVVVTAKVCR